MSAPRFQLLSLDDGSSTWIDTECGQAMHSKLGAWREATELYLQGSGVLEALKSKNPLCIWDVGMGTASNAVAAIQASQGPLRMVSFENAPDGLKLALENPEAFPFLLPYREPAQKLLKSGEVLFEQDRLHWELHTGDFFDHLKGLPHPDFIFWDFYAPQVVPQLWSFSAFQSVRNALTPGAAGKLITYASATSIRTAMMLAGFYVGEGPSTQAKKETTHAAYGDADLREKPLAKQWLEKVQRSSKPFPSDWIVERDGDLNRLLDRLVHSPHAQRFWGD